MTGRRKVNEERVKWSEMGVKGVFFRGDGVSEEFPVREGLAIEGEAAAHGGEGKRRRGEESDGVGDGGNGVVELPVVGEGDGEGVEEGRTEGRIQREGVEGAACIGDGFRGRRRRVEGGGENPRDVVEDGGGWGGFGEFPEVAEGGKAVVVAPKKGVIREKMAGDDAVGIGGDGSGFSGEGEGGGIVAELVGSNHGDLEEDFSEDVAGVRGRKGGGSGGESVSGAVEGELGGGGEDGPMRQTRVRRGIGEEKGKGGLGAVEGIDVGDVAEEEIVVGEGSGGPGGACAGGGEIPVGAGETGVVDADGVMVGEKAAGGEEQGVGVAPDRQVEGGGDGAGRACAAEKGKQRRTQPEAGEGTWGGQRPNRRRRGLRFPAWQKKVEEPDGEADGGEERITIGDEVVGDGDETGNGEEKEGGESGPEKKEGGGGAAAEEPNGGRHEGESEDGPQPKGSRPLGIEDGKTPRKEGFGEIEKDDGGDGGESGKEGRRRQRSLFGMKGGSQEGRECGEREPDKKEGKEAGEAVLDWRAAGDGRRKPLQKGEKDGEGDERGLGEESQGKEEKGGGPVENPPGRRGRIPGGEPCVEGQEAEEDREAVFAFRDPGDGFDAEGMKRPEEGEEETRRDGRRAAGGGAGRRETAGEAEEKKKEEEGGGGVEEDVREMERPRVVAEQGNVQHVGNPEEGDVHGGGGDGGEEGIADGGQAESPDDERVGRNKRKVVQGDEFKSDGGEV